MFAVLYRGYIYPEQEKEYQKSWNKIADYFVKHRGALGSCLHKTDDDEYIAYSRWPNRQTRDASWGDNIDASCLPEEILHAMDNLKRCIDRSQPFDEICMDVVDDLFSTLGK